MEIITQYVKFLKSRRSFQSRKYQDRKNSSPEAAAKHQQTAATYSEIIQWFEQYLISPSVIKSESDDDLFSLNPLEMEDLPEEIRQELSVSASDLEDAQVLELLEIAGRPLDLNEVIVGSLRKYDVRHKRNLLTARIYRLVKRDLVHNVGKGTYALGPEPKNANKEEELETEI